VTGPPTISVIVPAWNEEDYITATLEAVFEAAGRLERAGAAAEVVVVDNESSDATVERATRFPVRVLREEAHRMATVRNTGARAARGKYIAFVDADSRPSPNALVRISEVLGTGRYVGGGVSIRPDRWIPRALPLYAAIPVIRLFYGVSAGMIFATREAFDAVGGFDETLYASEDLAIGRALKKFGRQTGKKFANLSDVRIVTSVRKFEKAPVRDFLIFFKYLYDKDAVRRRDQCALWYRETNK